MCKNQTFSRAQPQNRNVCVWMWMCVHVNGTKYDEQDTKCFAFQKQATEQKNKNFSNYGKPEKLNKSEMEANC